MQQVNGDEHPLSRRRDDRLEHSLAEMTGTQCAQPEPVGLVGAVTGQGDPDPRTGEQEGGPPDGSGHASQAYPPRHAVHRRCPRTRSARATATVATVATTAAPPICG